MKTLICFLALAFTPLAARAAEEVTPESVAKRQIEAMRALNWDVVAKYTHPKALEQMHSLFMPVAIAGSTAKDNPAAEEMMRIVFGGKTANELAAISPTAFFKIVMTGISGATPEFKNAMTGMEITILGHVNENENLSHVVYRLSRPLAEGTATKIAVTSVERDGDTWKALLNADLENVARAISSRLQTP